MRTKAYIVWSNMIQRCRNKNNPQYNYYGGRGISVCGRWQKFKNFYDDMGDPPPRHQIDRIDNDGNYSKDNCRWVTRSQNLRNKRTNRKITLNGESHTVTEWSERTGLNTRTLHSRLSLGWPAKMVLEAPLRKIAQRNKRHITYNGITDSVAGWSRRIGVEYATLWWRISKGWPPERAFKNYEERDEQYRNSKNRKTKTNDPSANAWRPSKNRRCKKAV